MNYNALLLLDKHHHKLKKDYSSNIINNNQNQISLNKEKSNKYINIHKKSREKNNIIEKCYSVKPSSYIMPKDIILKDIFKNSMKKMLKKNNINDDIDFKIDNESNINRKNILGKIKKIILDKYINYNIFNRTIFLYDLLCLKKKETKNKFFTKFKNSSNALIALTAFILVLKFNYQENKMIRVKKIFEIFDNKDEYDFSLNDIYEMEIYSLKLINYDMTFYTPFSFLELFLINGIVFNEDYLKSDASFNIYESVKDTLENIMETSNEYLKYNFFHLCCSIIAFIREKNKIIKWPKVLEINFGINYDEFDNIYKIFFQKNENNKSNMKCFYNSDIINIKNLKNINNIINVLKIMKSADKYRKIKDKASKVDSISSFSPNNDSISQSLNSNIINNNQITNSLNKIKVGLKKSWNEISFKSPEKPNISKLSISSMISKLNEDSINRMSSLYIKSIEKKYRENKTNKKQEKSLNKTNNSSDNEISEQDEINELESINKYNMAKSHNKYRRNIYLKNRYNQMNNKSYIHSFKSNLDTSYNENKNKNTLYQNNNFFTKKSYNILTNYKDKKKDLRENNLNKNNINIYAQSNPNLNTFNHQIKRYEYYNKYKEKEKNQEILNSQLNRKQNMITTNNNNSNLNQTSFDEFRYYKYKPTKKEERSIIDNTSKNNQENSDIPTCESSDPKLSFNDFSIRQTYRNKKTKNGDWGIKGAEEKKYEKGWRKGIDKSKLYNKLKSAKISFGDSTCNPKIGLRKFYKQKLEENNCK